MTGGVVVALVVGWVWLGEDGNDAVAGLSRDGVAWLICLMIFIVFVLDVACARGDARLVRIMPWRVAREVRAPMMVVLGRFVTWWMVVASGTVVFFAVALLIARPGWAWLPRGLAALLIVAQQGVSVVIQVRREPLAVDVPSLLIDEQLRSREARLGLSLFQVALVLCLLGSGPAGTHLPDCLWTPGRWLALFLTFTSIIAVRAQTGPLSDRWTSPIRLVPRDPASLSSLEASPSPPDGPCP